MDLKTLVRMSKDMDQRPLLRGLRGTYPVARHAIRACWRVPRGQSFTQRARLGPAQCSPKSVFQQAHHLQNEPSVSNAMWIRWQSKAGALVVE